MDGRHGRTGDDDHVRPGGAEQRRLRDVRVQRRRARRFRVPARRRAWAACTSPQAYADLADGAHTFRGPRDRRRGQRRCRGVTRLDGRHRAVRRRRPRSPSARPTDRDRDVRVQRRPRRRRSSAASTRATGRLARARSATPTWPTASTPSRSALPTPPETRCDAATYTWTVDTAAPATTIRPARRADQRRLRDVRLQRRRGRRLRLPARRWRLGRVRLPAEYTDLADGEHTFQRARHRRRRQHGHGRDPRLDRRHRCAGDDDRRRTGGPDHRSGGALRVQRRRGRRLRVPARRRRVGRLRRARRRTRTSPTAAQVRGARDRPRRQHRSARIVRVDDRAAARLDGAGDDDHRAAGRLRATAPRRPSHSRRPRRRRSSAGSTTARGPRAPARRATRTWPTASTCSASARPMPQATSGRPRRTPGPSIRSRRR